jgi:hypothetical protein
MHDTQGIPLLKADETLDKELQKFIAISDIDLGPLLAEIWQEDFLFRRNREQTRFRLSEFLHTMSPDNHRLVIELNQFSDFLTGIHAPSRANNLHKFIGNMRSRCAQDPFLASTWGRLSRSELEKQILELQWLLIQRLVNESLGLHRYFVICDDPDDANAIHDTLILRVETLAGSPLIRKQIDECLLPGVNIASIKSSHRFGLACLITETIKNVEQPDPYFSRHILVRLYRLMEDISICDPLFQIMGFDARLAKVALLLILETRGSILNAHFSLSNAFFGVSACMSLFESVFERLRSISIPTT